MAASPIGQVPTPVFQYSPIPAMSKTSLDAFSGHLTFPSKNAEDVQSWTAYYNNVVNEFTARGLSKEQIDTATEYHQLIQSPNFVIWLQRTAPTFVGSAVSPATMNKIVYSFGKETQHDAYQADMATRITQWHQQYANHPSNTALNEILPSGATMNNKLDLKDTNSWKTLLTKELTAASAKADAARKTSSKWFKVLIVASIILFITWFILLTVVFQRKAAPSLVSTGVLLISEIGLFYKLSKVSNKEVNAEAKELIAHIGLEVIKETAFQTWVAKHQLSNRPVFLSEAQQIFKIYKAMSQRNKAQKQLANLVVFQGYPALQQSHLARTSTPSIRPGQAYLNAVTNKAHPSKNELIRVYDAPQTKFCGEKDKLMIKLGPLNYPV